MAIIINVVFRILILVNLQKTDGFCRIYCPLVINFQLQRESARLP